jgi:PAS domain S-box-containing protein
MEKEPGTEKLKRLETDVSASIAAIEYRELLEGNPLPMWIYDSESLRFLTVNKAAISIYGYSHGEFLGMKIKDLCPGPLDPMVAPASADETHFQVKHRKRDGTIISVEVIRYQILFAGRKSVVEINREIAEKNREQLNVDPQNQELEVRVRERTGQLETINRELEAFCYSVSHDLRAPLRSIRGFSEVLLERYGSKVDAKGQTLLRRVCESSQIMDRLIEDLLKLSRVTRVELKRRTVNLSALAGEIADKLREAEPSRPVQFVIAPDLKAEGDERLLHVVLDNLLRNAWKFTSKRSETRIEVGLTSEPECAFFVSDNGAGFDMAYADKLFGVFQRLHPLEEFDGTGIGLANVRRIVHRHGGRTWAEAKVDEGASFYFTVQDRIKD